MFPQQLCARVLIILFLVTAMSGQSAKKPLTNTDVMDMVHAGLAESTIILSIKNSGTDFDTSPQALIELKKSGVSQSIMDAMASPKRDRQSRGRRSDEQEEIGMMDKRDRRDEAR